MFFKKEFTSEKVIVIAALGLLGGVGLSWPLWDEAARTSFPLLPFFGEAAQKGDGFFQPIFTVGLIFCVAFFPRKKILLAAAIGWLLWLCLLDINRLQPWVWFCLLVFAVVFFGKKDNEAANSTALRWLLAGVYFWSGFNKLTPYFAEDNFEWFCEAFDFTKRFGQFPLLGYAVALLEMTFAAGLIWEKTRPCFRWMAIGFHAVIIIFLLKMDWNWVVIPWNLAMAAMVWVLNPTPSPTVSAPPPKGRGAQCTPSLPSLSGLGVGFAWLAPFFYFFHLWPHNLSWQLYSNTQPEMTFYCEAGSTFYCASDFYENETQKMWNKLAYDNGSKLLLDDWANGELRVPMFTAERTFRQVGKYLCGCTANPDSAGIFILKVNRWNKSAEKMEKIPCRKLTAE